MSLARGSAMRWLSIPALQMIVSVAALVSLPAPARADDALSSETFPYVAYVTADGAQVHAGPGNAHYATDSLSQGMKVEVLREISGWLAIRPPIGSFSWIPAREAELTDEPDVAMILSDDVPAWIGTRIDRDADHLWQVQLNQGDHVKVLDVKRRPSASGKAPESWYRIEPPSEELRFIRATDVSREPPAALATTESKETADNEKEDDAKPAELLAAAAQRAKPLDDPAAAEDAANVDATEAEKTVLPAQFVPRDSSKQRVTRPSTPAAKSAATERPASPFKEVGGAAGSVEAPRVASLDRLPATDTNSLLSASSRFEDKLTDIELQLSLMAAREPRDWQLDPLRAQAEQLVVAGKTTLERGRARLVLDKIAQFDELYIKAVEVNELSRTARLTSVTESTVAGPSASKPAVSSSKSLTLPDGVTYDGVGWLKPVYSAKRVAPPYALVDVDGKVLQYVTPAPGLNLNRYVKKPVGMFGQKSRLNAFNADHLTAAKVVDLTKYQK